MSSGMSSSCVLASTILSHNRDVSCNATPITSMLNSVFWEPDVRMRLPWSQLDAGRAELGGPLSACVAQHSRPGFLKESLEALGIDWPCRNRRQDHGIEQVLFDSLSICCFRSRLTATAMVAGVASPVQWTLASTCLPQFLASSMAGASGDACPPLRVRLKGPHAAHQPCSTKRFSHPA